MSSFTIVFLVYVPDGGFPDRGMDYKRGLPHIIRKHLKTHMSEEGDQKVFID